MGLKLGMFQGQLGNPLMAQFLKGNQTPGTMYAGGSPTFNESNPGASTPLASPPVWGGGLGGQYTTMPISPIAQAPADPTQPIRFAGGTPGFTEGSGGSLLNIYRGLA
jgi:hypothetical protein